MKNSKFSIVTLRVTIKNTTLNMMAQSNAIKNMKLSITTLSITTKIQNST